MLQVDGFKRPSPSPSRSSVRSDSRVFRPPRVIHVNRDASTMVDDDAAGAGGAPCLPGGASLVSDWENLEQSPANFRSRTFSDGFIRNTSLELLLGVDCEACLALAAQRQCAHEHISDHDFNLVCNCSIQQNNYLNCHRDVVDHRGHTLNIYDLERMKRGVTRNHHNIGSHRSLDRKYTRNKHIGVSNYFSKQLIAYDPTNTLVQKIKRKLSNLKKIGGDAMLKKNQNAVQLAEITSGSTNSLKKLSMLSVVDKSQRKVNSQSCIFTSSEFQSKDELKTNATTYANFSGNVDQCFDRLRECNVSADASRRAPPKMMKMRSFDNNDEMLTRHSAAPERMKFSTLDNRSRCRSIRRQMSYNDFPSERFRDRGSDIWTRDESLEGSKSAHNDLVDDESQSFVEADRIALGGLRGARAHCTCEGGNNRIPSIFYDTHGKKRAAPAPDVTERGTVRPAACSVCKSPQWMSTGTSTASHSSTTGNSSRFSVWHRRWCCVAILVLVAGTACVAGPLALRAPPGAPLHERLRLAERLLHDSPLIDGHNDLPWNIRKFLHNRIKDFRSLWPSMSGESWSRRSASRSRSCSGAPGGARSASGPATQAVPATSTRMATQHHRRCHTENPVKLPTNQQPYTGFSVWHRRWCCVAILVLVAGTACVAGPLALRAPPGAPLHERLRLAERLLHDSPLIDGHNDLPWNIRKFLHNRIKDFRFDEDLRTISPWATSSWSHTDLPRLKQGRVAGQFWAAYVPCDAQHRDAVQLTFEQIDLIQRLTDKYHPQLTLCTSADDIVSAHANHRMCSLVGVEGGHAIGGSLGVLRTLYQVGVRYLTLTSTCDTPWAECASADRIEPSPRGGLTPFGKVVVKEMNRLGMLVDLSHVSERTMRDALMASRAPVIFSHSSARALCNVTRNVPDTVLRLLAANKGLIMVNFYTSFLTCKETATVQNAIEHINHIRDVAGVDCVGLGAGYDGINYTPQGLEDVSSYPLLFAELMEAGWSIEDLKKLAGLNLLRVLGAAERVAQELASAHVTPYEEVPPRPLDTHNCSSQDL